MRKLIIMTDEATADGFRLAGVDVIEASLDDMTATKRQLVQLINDDDIGVIGIDEDLMAAVDEATRMKIDKLYRPIVIAIPAKKKLEVSETRHAFLASMIRRAIGFDIKIGREET